MGESVVGRVEKEGLGKLSRPSYIVKGPEIYYSYVQDSCSFIAFFLFNYLFIFWTVIVCGKQP